MTILIPPIVAIILMLNHPGQQVLYMDNVTNSPYFGLKEPLDTAELFAPGIISGPFDERMVSFIREGTECYFQIRGVPRSTVFYTNLTSKGWTIPVTAFFSGYNFEEFTFSRDGNTLVFTTNKPLPGAKIQEGLFHLWKAERKNDLWDDPYPLEKHFEGAGYPSIAGNGNIYFFANFEGGTGNEDIYFSKFTDGFYQTPICLGPKINSTGNEVDPFIAPDESYLIFSSDRNGSGGLFISYRNGEDWSNPVFLGEDIGDGESICPTVSSDGRYLFFTSKRINTTFPADRRASYSEKKLLLYSPCNGSNDIYWINLDYVIRK